MAQIGKFNIPLHIYCSFELLYFHTNALKSNIAVSISFWGQFVNSFCYLFDHKF